jgi:hypothetical protein
MQTVLDALAIQDAIAQRLKASIGAPAATQVGAQDIGALAQLQVMKDEADERRRQWETEQEDKKRRWAIDDRQWEQKFHLELKKFDAEQGKKDDAMSQLGDLVAAIVESKKNGGIAVSSQPSVASPSQVSPKTMMCGTCGTLMKLPETATPFNCPGCKALYAPAGSAATQPPPEMSQPDPQPVAEKEPEGAML